MKRLFTLTLGVLALSAATAGTVSAQSSTTFATFSQDALGSRPFSFVNSAGPVLTGSATAVPVEFNFGTAFLADASLANQSVSEAVADFTFTATSAASSTALPGGEVFIIQPSLAGTIVITASSAGMVGGVAYNAGDVLLTASFSSSSLSGFQGTNAASLNAAVPANAVVFNADSKFFNFAGAFGQNLGLSFTGADSALGINANGLLNSFNTDGGAASFAATLVVPEPASLAMAGLGLLGVGFIARRRLAK